MIWHSKGASDEPSVDSGVVPGAARGLGRGLGPAILTPRRRRLPGGTPSGVLWIVEVNTGIPKLISLQDFRLRYAPVAQAA